jgi:toxin FitB
VFLLDTNVISEMRKERPHGAVVAWLDAASGADLYLSALTVGELQAGVEVTRRQDPDRAAELDRWVDWVLETLQVLPMDGRTFRVWARLFHGRPRELAQDAMIAATAAVHGLTVATRNVRDFVPFGVPVINPFETPRSG